MSHHNFFGKLQKIWQSLKAVFFGGIDEYLTASDHADLDFEYNVPSSVSFWVKTSASSTLNRVISKVENSSATRGWGIGIDTANKVYAYLVSDWSASPSNAIQLRTSSGVVFGGTWYHVTVTYDGTSAASGFTIYVGGSSKSISVDNDDLSATCVNSELLQVAKRNGVSSGIFVGNLDEISIWDKELSSSEVSEIYNTGKPDDLERHSANSSLVAWWHMGDGDTYPTLKDAKNSHDFTMVNMESGNIESDVP